MAPIRQTLFELFLGLLAPAGCAACEKPLPRGVFCRACGAPPDPLPEDIDGVPVLAAGTYAPPLSTAIRRMKYEARPDLARPLSSLLFHTAKDLGLGKEDAFVPVPLHRARLVERGFNQAALVASELARHTHASFAPTLLERRREMQHQARLGRDARSDNAFGAFTVRTRAIYRRVVLVDDVVTTGATARACLAALAEREIQVLAIVALAHAAGPIVLGSKP